MKALHLRKFLKLLLAAIFIEIFIINFSNVVNLVNASYSKNIYIDMKKVDYINWNFNGEYITSKEDPIIILNNINTYIKNVSIDIDSEQPIDYIDIFYTNESINKFNGELLIREENPVGKNININIDKEVRDLRIDLGDRPGLSIKHIDIVLNQAKIDFNISRVITIMLIYLAVLGLGYIQKNPDYEINK